MKKILYIIMAACVGVFGYKCSSTCRDLFLDIAEHEENRGITIASPQGTRVAIYREGKQGAPNEEIVLSDGGNISWCGITVREHEGTLVVSYRQQTEVIHPEDMRRMNEEGTEQEIWNAVILDEDAHYIRLSCGECTEPPCAAASMSKQAFMKLAIRDYMDHFFIADVVNLLCLICALILVLLLYFFPLRRRCFAVYAIFAMLRAEAIWKDFENVSWKIRDINHLERLLGTDLNFVLLKKRDGKLYMCSNRDKNWCAFLWNVEHGKSDAARQCIEEYPPKMLPVTATFTQKIIFAWCSV